MRLISWTLQSGSEQVLSGFYFSKKIPYNPTGEFWDLDPTRNIWTYLAKPFRLQKTEKGKKRRKVITVLSVLSVMFLST